MKRSAMERAANEAELGEFMPTIAELEKEFLRGCKELRGKSFTRMKDALLGPIEETVCALEGGNELGITTSGPTVSGYLYNADGDEIGFVADINHVITPKELGEFIKPRLEIEAVSKKRKQVIGSLRLKE